MTGVRNGCVGRFHSSATGWTRLLTVPPGMTLLLKSVEQYNGSAAAAQLQLVVTSIDGVVNAVLSNVQLAANSSASWAGWIALNPGDSVSVYAGAPGLDFWASGALLPGSADLPLPSTSGPSSGPL